jgi:hypothetical protein
VHSRWRYYRVIAEVEHLDRGRSRERDRNVGVADIDPEVVTHQTLPPIPKKGAAAARGIAVTIIRPEGVSCQHQVLT